MIPINQPPYGKCNTFRSSNRQIEKENIRNIIRFSCNDSVHKNPNKLKNPWLRVKIHTTAACSETSFNYDGCHRTLHSGGYHVKKSDDLAIDRNIFRCCYVINYYIRIFI